MTLPIRVLVMSAIVGLPLGSYAAQHHPETPAGMTHDHHMPQMKKDAKHVLRLNDARTN